MPQRGAREQLMRGALLLRLLRLLARRRGTPACLSGEGLKKARQREREVELELHLVSTAVASSTSVVSG